MFHGDPKSLKPCRHMTGLVSALADKTLKGPLRWFALQHVSGCSRCHNGLEYFQALRGRLETLEGREAVKKELSPEQWARVEAEWEKRDQETASPPSQAS